MTKEIIGGALIKEGKPLPLSKAVRAGDFIYVSGQLAFDKDGKIVGDTIEAQTEQTMENLKSILTLAGAEMSDVVKCTAWIADEKDFARFNAVYSRYFASEPPARSCIPSKLLFGGLVEVEAIAYKPR